MSVNLDRELYSELGGLVVAWRIEARRRPPGRMRDILEEIAGHFDRCRDDFWSAVLLPYAALPYLEGLLALVRGREMLEAVAEWDA